MTCARSRAYGSSGSGIGLSWSTRSNRDPSTHLGQRTLGRRSLWGAPRIQRVVHRGAVGRSRPLGAARCPPPCYLLLVDRHRSMLPSVAWMKRARADAALRRRTRRRRLNDMVMTIGRRTPRGPWCRGCADRSGSASLSMEKRVPATIARCDTPRQLCRDPPAAAAAVAMPAAKFSRLSTGSRLRDGRGQTWTTRLIDRVSRRRPAGSELIPSPRLRPAVTTTMPADSVTCCQTRQETPGCLIRARQYPDPMPPVRSRNPTSRYGIAAPILCMRESSSAKMPPTPARQPSGGGPLARDQRKS